MILCHGINTMYVYFNQFLFITYSLLNSHSEVPFYFELYLTRVLTTFKLNKLLLKLLCTFKFFIIKFIYMYNQYLHQLTLSTFSPIPIPPPPTNTQQCLHIFLSSTCHFVNFEFARNPTWGPSLSSRVTISSLYKEAFV